MVVVKRICGNSVKLGGKKKGAYKRRVYIPWYLKRVAKNGGKDVFKEKMGLGTKS